MMKFGLKGLLLLLAAVLFIVGALSDRRSYAGSLLYWGLAVFAASFIVESIPLGNMMAGRTRER